MWWAAFVMGFTGSRHCVVMCGPLAALVGGGKRSVLYHRLIYHVGKACTYLLLGLLLATFGTLLAVKNIQHIASIVAGVGMLVFVILPRRLPFEIQLFAKINTFIRQVVGTQIKAGKVVSPFVFGMLNGILPCGLLYMALIVAAVQPTYSDTLLVMGCFALGTFPALLATSYSLPWLFRQLPISFELVKNLLLVAVALLLIARGIYTGYWAQPDCDTPLCL